MADPRKPSVAAPVGSDESGAFPEQNALFNSLVARSVTVLPNSPYTPNPHAPAGTVSIGADPQVNIPVGGLSVISTNPGPTDDWTSQFFRNAQYTGGAHGFTNFALKVQTNVGANVSAYEWALLGLIDNSATDPLQNSTAIYGQGKKEVGAGPTWAGTFEILDANTSGPTSAVVACEFDVSANGTDASNARIGIDLFVRKFNAGGTAATAYAGLRVNQSDTSHWNYGIIINDANLAGIVLQSGVAASTGIQFAGTQTIGINFTGTLATGIAFDSGTFSTAVLRFKRQQLISLEATSTQQLQMFSVSDSILKFLISSVEKVGIDTGTPGLRINATQVVTARQTGYTNAWTGTLERAAALATGSATLVAVAQRLAAIQADLVAHGLLGP